MSYVKPENLEQLRKIDALSYLLSCERNDLMRDGLSRYRLQSEHSCVISPKGWYAWKRRKGGKSAIDFLCEIRGLSLIEACQQVGGTSVVHFERTELECGEFNLPPPNDNNRRVYGYLRKRGIDETIIKWCFDNNFIYEAERYGSCVFVGYDEETKPKYAFVRGTYGDSKFRQEVRCSQKKYCFRIANVENTTVNVFEGAIDALSFATLMNNKGKDWQSVNYLSLGGTTELPLLNFLERIPQTKKINICLDNDKAGIDAGRYLRDTLQKNYEVAIHYPRYKDWNDYLYKKQEQIRECYV